MANAFITLTQQGDWPVGPACLFIPGKLLPNNEAFWKLVDSKDHSEGEISIEDFQGWWQMNSCDLEGSLPCVGRQACVTLQDLIDSRL